MIYKKFVMLLTDKAYARLPEYSDFYKILLNSSLDNCTARFNYINFGEDKHVFYGENISFFDDKKGNFKFELDFFLAQLSFTKGELYDIYLVELTTSDKATEITNCDPFDPFGGILTPDIKFKVDGIPLETRIKTII